MTIPAEDSYELMAELEQLAQRQRALREELAEVVDARTRLISEARRRNVATWRQLALMFGMTEHGLIKADTVARAQTAEHADEQDQ